MIRIKLFQGMIIFQGDDQNQINPRNDDFSERLLYSIKLIQGMMIFFQIDDS